MSVQEPEVDKIEIPVRLALHNHKSLLGLALQSNSLIRSLWKFRKCIRDRNPSLIHTNGSLALFFSTLGNLGSKIPLVFHCRDFLKDNWRNRTLLFRAGYTLVATEFMRDRLIKGFGYPEERVFNVGNPVEKPHLSEEISPSLPEELGHPQETRFVTMIAQLVAWKRHDLFLQAAARISRDFPDVHFLIVGKDLWNEVSEYEQGLRNLVRNLDLQDRVSFLGHREDVGRILKESEVMALPSLHEPFGRVVVEAWWMGTPVVVSNCGGPAEIVEDGVSGLRFRSGDAKDLAEKIRGLLVDPSLATSLAEEARTRVDRFSPAAHAKAVLAVYDRILS